MNHRYAMYHSNKGLSGTIGFINKTHPHWDIVSIQEFSMNKTLVTHRVQIKEEEPHQFAAVTWGIGDIESLRPDWSELMCALFLKKYESRLVDSLIFRGRQILNDLLSESEMEQGDASS